ncbi:competence protein [Rathayibacter sp. AY1E8]|uniref:CinA family protein n=1 Tax=unclassified Rathayibacter TaxID=2609250 RepID=UPI000CE8E5EF|nr:MULTISPECIES: CinA family protein [unclassified Rathayibacter]PPF12047.1 competence protein [Rathayibacter sp. AY1A5]PPF45128.1 competence protein [Rathayibacter sp. AY1A1]PPF72181.1 competence protein [Rathayibacter sp. AY1E6]PPG07444.1 competence protein [Rathayibacter sp. AY2B1]PPG17723.1 competence protein [Rathayibacter sp. AY1C6]
MTAAQLIAELRRRGVDLAVAESLTGGALSSALVEVPGASAVYRGGVVSYATDLKDRLLGVDARVLGERGPVDPGVAVQMARGASSRLAADGRPTLGLATTGVAGPDPQGDAAVGTVFVAAVLGEDELVREHRFDGDRAAIRAASVDAALALGAELISRGA